MKKLYVIAISYDTSKFNSETQIIGIFDSLKSAEAARQRFITHINDESEEALIKIELEEWCKSIEIKKVDLNETYLRNEIILKN